MPWYYVHDNQSQGPVSNEQLEQLLVSGKLSTTCLIWEQGMTAWRPAHELFDLSSLTRPVAAPATAPALSAEKRPPPSPSSPPPMAEPTVSSAPLKMRFTGTWLGYYRVWFKGIVLTVLTLGLYAPWAKVRNKRYLYAHTRLGDDGFDYTADPRRILVGNLIVASLFITWMLSHFFNRWLPYLLIGVGVLVLPWIISRTLRFNARVTRWRGLRFNFTGTAWGCFLTFFFLPLACLGVFWPAAARARRKWLVGSHCYGDTAFAYQTSLVELYGIYLRTLLFFVPAGLCYAGVMLRAYVEQQSHLSPGDAVYLPFPWMVNLVVAGPEILPFMIPVALGGIDYLQARLFTCHWNGTALGDHTFHAYMAPWDVFKLRLLHYAALTASLGLLWPWVKIHSHTFKLDCLDFAPASSLGDLTGGKKTAANTHAIGDSTSDFLDFDIGL